MILEKRLTLLIKQGTVLLPKHQSLELLRIIRLGILPTSNIQIIPAPTPYIRKRKIVVIISYYYSIIIIGLEYPAIIGSVFILPS